jgi:hypothetical protein
LFLQILKNKIMKVYLGDYPEWFGPHKLAETLCFWVKDVEDELGLPKKPDWVDAFGDWIAKTWIRDVLEWIESKKLKLIRGTHGVQTILLL